MSQTGKVLLALLVSRVLQLGLTEDDARNDTHRAIRRLLSKESVDVRPNAGGEADVIEVGILCSRLFSINVRDGMYSADVILTLRWKDERVIDLLPEGRESFTMDKDAAAKDIWVPNVVPTNRDIKGLEEISQTTNINAEGRVERTRRMMVRMRQAYSLAAYPYDTQTLQVVVASSRYMFDQVELAIIDDDNYKGVGDKVTGTQPWNLHDWRIITKKETSGSLKKSRCVLEMEIQRKSAGVYEGTVLPEILLVVIAWCVFFLPMMVQFVVPRVATCLVCFLTMAQMTNKTVASLPDTGDLTWIHLWEQCCSYLLFLSAVFNAGTEVIAERFNMKPFAERLRLEMAVGFAGLGLLLAYMTHSRTDGQGLSAMCWFARIAVMFALIGFGGRGARHVYNELKANG